MTPKASLPSSTRFSYPSGDSLRLAAFNLAAGALSTWGSERFVSADAEAIAAFGLFVTPALALLTGVLAIRDIRNGKQADVALAAVLTLLALWVGWWPALQAD